MPAPIDLTGHEPGEYGTWTVLRRDAERGRGARWVCLLGVPLTAVAVGRPAEG